MSVNTFALHAWSTDATRTPGAAHSPAARGARYARVARGAAVAGTAVATIPAAASAVATDSGTTVTASPAVPAVAAENTEAASAAAAPTGSSRTPKTHRHACPARRPGGAALRPLATDDSACYLADQPSHAPQYDGSAFPSFDLGKFSAKP